ncbi:LysR family transcriptional regulator [Novispirillum itersonii]|uniref:LysR family transcriptional regulator n=1 Tax=Novispirillum itersonii TaxID=189 RepID=UPI00036C0EAF|nr:LysR family transcriptional regulator [Novispirillum itersonii]
MDTPSDLAFFATLARHGTLAAAAQDLGITAPAVSRRLSALEARLGVRLLNRTTRRQSLTAEGERYLTEGRRILGDLDALERSLTAARDTPRGLLRVNSGIGFGRRHLGPAVSDFAALYPDVDVILHLSDKPMDLAAEGFDLCTRIGLGGDTGLISRKIASNRRFLAAAPAYLARHPAPQTPQDLQQHQCIVIREYFGAYNSWPLVSGSRRTTVKVNGRLASNHGEVAVDWAIAGHGIILRSQWDIAHDLRAGRLVRVLPDWCGVDTDIYALTLPRLLTSAKVTAFLDFLTDRFADHRRSEEYW